MVGQPADAVGCATTHRQEIVAWLCEQAARQGVTVHSETVAGLVLAAFKEWGKQNNVNELGNIW